MINYLKWKFVQFMYGRYGVDQFFIDSTILIVALQLLQIILRSSYLTILTLAIMIGTFYRTFSKNITARQAENQKYLEISHPIKSKGKLFMRRFKDSRTHRYRQCQKCETILRLPRKRGTHRAHCPKCSNSFEVKIWV